MSTAIIVPHQLPAPAMEIVAAATVDRRAALLSSVASFPGIISPEIAEEANKLLLDLAAVEKDIEAQVERHSKPVHLLHKAILAVGKTAVEPIAFAKTSMRGQIGAWNRKQEEARQAAQAKADAERKAAEEAAEKERARLQAIADKEHAEKVAAAEAERKRLQAEADAKAEADRQRIQAEKDAEARELEALLGAPVTVEQVKVEATRVVVEAPAPVVVKVEAQPVVTSVTMPAVAKSAVTTRMVPKLIIDDATLIPAYFAGQELRPVNNAAVKAAIDAGLTVPGAHVELVPVDAIRRGA